MEEKDPSSNRLWSFWSENNDVSIKMHQSITGMFYKAEAKQVNKYFSMIPREAVATSSIVVD